MFPVSEAFVSLRRRLHQEAELSSQEEKTAAIIDDFLKGCGPDAAIRGLGGHGAAYIFEGENPGSTILIRADLDALPIPESIELEYGSRNPGVSHKCGHDGHMSILAWLAASLAESRPAHGRAILLFQPAEEIGEGAARVIADERFRDLEPDLAVALHNLPGHPLGQVVLRQGAFNCASLGLVARLRGETSHAAEPEAARSPSQALTGLLRDLPRLAPPLGDAALLTITHACLGEPSLGITPGDALLMATLRAASDATLAELLRKSEELIVSAAALGQVDLTLEHKEPFHAVLNAKIAVDAASEAARSLELSMAWLEEPLRFSEDFAEFTRRYSSVLFGLGAGLEQPPLHHPAYDFPDALIPIGGRLLRRILDQQLSKG